MTSVAIIESDNDGAVEFGIAGQFAENCDGTPRDAATRNTLSGGSCALLRFRYLPNADGKDDWAVAMVSGTSTSLGLLLGSSALPAAFSRFVDPGSRLVGVSRLIDFDRDGIRESFLELLHDALRG